MPTILNATEIIKVIGTVICNGDLEAIRPNSYVLRLGESGAFIRTSAAVRGNALEKDCALAP